MQDASIMASWTFMNDYNYVRCEHDEDIVQLFPQKTIEWHKKSVAYIEKICSENPDKKIVIISHHAPSKKSIGSQYRKSEINPAYASNLEWLIKKYKNIKLWVSGHSHNDSDYYIGNCRCVARPFGYYNENNRSLTEFGEDRGCLGFTVNTEDL